MFQADSWFPASTRPCVYMNLGHYLLRASILVVYLPDLHDSLGTCHLGFLKLLKQISTYCMDYNRKTSLPRWMSPGVTPCKCSRENHISPSFGCPRVFRAMLSFSSSLTQPSLDLCVSSFLTWTKTLLAGVRAHLDHPNDLISRVSSVAIGFFPFTVTSANSGIGTVHTLERGHFKTHFKTTFRLLLWILCFVAQKHHHPPCWMTAETGR